MKILSTESFDVRDFHKKNDSFNFMANKKRRSNEFKKILEEKLIESSEDFDEFRILLPKYGNFWDNGYEDKE